MLYSDALIQSTEWMAGASGYFEIEGMGYL